MAVPPFQVSPAAGFAEYALIRSPLAVQLPAEIDFAESCHPCRRVAVSMRYMGMEFSHEPLSFRGKSSPQSIR